MAARFRALRDDRIEPAMLGVTRVLHGARDIHDLEAGIVELLHQMRRGDAKAGNEGRGALLDDDVGGLLERFRHGGKQIDAERLFRQ